MICSNCKKDTALMNKDLCFDCFLASQGEFSNKLFCPSCLKETTCVFEYSVQGFQHRKIHEVSGVVYKDFDIFEDYYTCLECDKQFTVVREEER
nr:MAG TPA: Trm112p-like protein [Caudoviricetes sp.]